MKIKTAELIGPALDWAVAKIENPEWWDEFDMDSDPLFALDMDDGEIYAPSADWAQGGPIIERERLCARPLKEVWGCWVTDLYGDIHALSLSGFGPTPLIAAMRCYIASKLGDEVEIPEELI